MERDWSVNGRADVCIVRRSHVVNVVPSRGATKLAQFSASTKNSMRSVKKSTAACRCFQPSCLAANYSAAIGACLKIRL